MHAGQTEVTQAGYVVPTLDVVDLAKCIDDTIGERWFEPRDEACLRDEGPCLAWVNASSPHTTWRFDGVPFRLTIEQAMGEHVGDPQEAATTLNSLATPLVQITTHEREPGRYEPVAIASFQPCTAETVPSAVDLVEQSVDRTLWQVVRELRSTSADGLLDEVLADVA